jgi:phospholipase/carboxylesterase
MKHIYHKGTNAKTLLLLHGTGGNEYDLLPLAKMIDPFANVLSLRGNVLEYGMPRFFKRLAMGVFDMDSLIEETYHLYEFLQQASQDYGFDRQQVTAVGYSNGANMAASLLLHFDHPFEKAILYHPMVPIRNLPKTDLSRTSIFIGAGRTDHLMQPEEVDELEALFRYHQAKVTVFWTGLGHQLSKQEIDQSIAWYHQQ